MAQHYTFAEFLEAAMREEVRDEDGVGYYCLGDMELPNAQAIPSVVVNEWEEVPEEQTHVNWYRG
jgi:hypothetical protein